MLPDVPFTLVRFIRSDGILGVIDLHPRVGNPPIGTVIDGGRSGRWQVVKVLREAGTLVGAQVEAARR